MSLRSCVQSCLLDDGSDPPPRPTPPDNGGGGYYPYPYYPDDDDGYAPFPDDGGYDPYYPPKPTPPGPPQPKPDPPPPKPDDAIMKAKTKSCVEKQFPAGYDTVNDTCSFSNTGYQYPCANGGGDQYCCRELDLCAGPFPPEDLDPRRTWTPKQCMEDSSQGYFACLKHG